MKSIPVIKLSLVRIALKDICRMIEVRFPYGSPNKTNPNLTPVGDGFGFVVFIH